MSAEPDVKAVPEAEVLALLRRVAEEPASEVHGDEREEREARLAARLDAQIARLSGERRRARRARALLVSLAAAVPLGFWAARAAQRPGAVLALEREPVPSAARLSAPPVRVPSAPAPRAATQVLPPKSAERAPLAPTLSPTLIDAGAAPNDSTLGAENGLFRDAVNDAHSGSVDKALRGFERLLHDYPRSPLAQTALVRKFRVLSAAGRTAEARSEARRYLQTYPTGFAQREAEAVADGQTLLNASEASDAGDGTESP